MKYQITKEQYSKLVYNLIYVFFKDAEYTAVKDKKGNVITYDISVDGNNVAWVNNYKSGTYNSKGCKNELLIYDEVISKMTNFIPIFKKKVFSKILIKYFSDITGVNVDCIYFDITSPDDGTYDTYRRKLKKKK